MFRARVLQVGAGMVLSFACARTPAESESASPEPMSPSRAAASLTWQPGDSEAVAREVVRLVPLPTEGVVPMLFRTEIRNRCAEAVEFFVGPADAVPAADAASNPLAAGEAIVVGMAGEEWVHLKTTEGALKASAAGGWIVVTGEGANCGGIAGIDR